MRKLLIFLSVFLFLSCQSAVVNEKESIGNQAKTEEYSVDPYVDITSVFEDDVSKADQTSIMDDSLNLDVRESVEDQAGMVEEQEAEGNAPESESGNGDGIELPLVDEETTKEFINNTITSSEMVDENDFLTVYAPSIQVDSELPEEKSEKTPEKNVEAPMVEESIKEHQLESAEIMYLNEDTDSAENMVNRLVRVGVESSEDLYFYIAIVSLPLFVLTVLFFRKIKVKRRRSK